METMTVTAATTKGPSTSAAWASSPWVPLPCHEPRVRGTTRQSIIACQDCDALQTVRDPISKTGAVCVRCGALLVRSGGGHPGRGLAFALAAIPLFIAAITLPLIGMDGRGPRVEATVIGALEAFLDQRMPALATLVVVTTILLPAIHLGCTVSLLLGIARRSNRGRVFQLLEAIRPWTQIEILLFGILVAFGRLASVFHVVPGLGLLCMVGFLLLGKLASVSLDARRFWGQARRA
jgi:paraquat-inducible protein A